MTNAKEQFVLLLGGVSGTGKTTAAIEINRRLLVPWLQVDDLRLAFQRSRVTLPQGTEALYFLTDVEERRDFRQESPERLCEALIATGEVMSPAIEAVVLNHLDQRHPLVIEGDGIVPSLLSRPALQPRGMAGQIQTVFVVEPSETVLLDNMVQRGRGIDRMSGDDLRTEARAKWLFGQWLANEATRSGLPVIKSQPWESLVDRILQVVPISG